jgi:hypothetical protein
MSIPTVDFYCRIEPHSAQLKFDDLKRCIQQPSTLQQELTDTRRQLIGIHQVSWLMALIGISLYGGHRYVPSTHYRESRDPTWDQVYKYLEREDIGMLVDFD